MIEKLPGGTIVVSGERDTRFTQLLVLKGALKLEIKGMKLSRGKGSAYQSVKSMLGFKGNKVSVLAQLEKHIEEQAQKRQQEDEQAQQGQAQ